jgi:hypothetical protein
MRQMPPSCIFIVSVCLGPFFATWLQGRRAPSAAVQLSNVTPYSAGVQVCFVFNLFSPSSLRLVPSTPVSGSSAAPFISPLPLLLGDVATAAPPPFASFRLSEVMVAPGDSCVDRDMLSCVLASCTGAPSDAGLFDSALGKRCEPLFACSSSALPAGTLPDGPIPWIEQAARLLEPALGPGVSASHEPRIGVCCNRETAVQVTLAIDGALISPSAGAPLSFGLESVAMIDPRDYTAVLHLLQPIGLDYLLNRESGLLRPLRFRVGQPVFLHAGVQYGLSVVPAGSLGVITGFTESVSSSAAAVPLVQFISLSAPIPVAIVDISLGRFGVIRSPPLAPAYCLDLGLLVGMSVPIALIIMDSPWCASQPRFLLTRSKSFGAMRFIRTHAEQTVFSWLSQAAPSPRASAIDACVARAVSATAGMPSAPGSGRLVTQLPPRPLFVLPAFARMSLSDAISSMVKFLPHARDSLSRLDSGPLQANGLERPCFEWVSNQCGLSSVLCAASHVLRYSPTLASVARNVCREGSGAPNVTVTAFSICSFLAGVSGEKKYGHQLLPTLLSKQRDALFRFIIEAGCRNRRGSPPATVDDLVASGGHRPSPRVLPYFHTSESSTDAMAVGSPTIVDRVAQGVARGEPLQVEDWLPLVFGGGLTSLSNSGALTPAMPTHPTDAITPPARALRVMHAIAAETSLSVTERYLCAADHESRRLHRFLVPNVQLPVGVCSPSDLQRYVDVSLAEFNGTFPFVPAEASSAVTCETSGCGLQCTRRRFSAVLPPVLPLTFSRSVDAADQGVRGADDLPMYLSVGSVQYGLVSAISHKAGHFCGFGFDPSTGHAASTAASGAAASGAGAASAGAAYGAGAASGGAHGPVLHKYDDLYVKARQRVSQPRVVSSVEEVSAAWTSSGSFRTGIWIKGFSSGVSSPGASSAMSTSGVSAALAVVPLLPHGGALGTTVTHASSVASMSGPVLLLDAAASSRVAYDDDDDGFRRRRRRH